MPAPGHFFHPGYHGYHGYHPKCTTELEAVTKTLCRIEVEKECETKTKTYTKITGYEDTDCKEVEFKKPGKLYLQSKILSRSCVCVIAVKE